MARLFFPQKYNKRFALCYWQIYMAWGSPSWHAQWCAIGIVTSREPNSPNKRRGICVDLSLDTMHPKYPLILFGSEGVPYLLFFFIPLVINVMSLFFFKLWQRTIWHKMTSVYRCDLKLHLLFKQMIETLHSTPSIARCRNHWGCTLRYEFLK